MNLVEYMGIEPIDSHLAKIARNPIAYPVIGGPYRARTDDLMLAKQLLSQLS